MKKKPVTLRDIERFEVRTFDDWMMRGVCLIGLFGLMRINEILSGDLISQNVSSVNESMVKIFLPSSKIDGHWGILI